MLFPFHFPIYIPRTLWNGFLDTLRRWRIIPPRQDPPRPDRADECQGRIKPFVRLDFPVNFVTAPLVADLFLLAILAIGRQEVHDGTVGSDNISPIDVMVFFITLAYIAISIDASGLIRYLAFKVLQKGGQMGHRLFFYLYLFFFGLGSFIGNDPIILSGTPFLAYMTRVSSNIMHPRAWIHTQFTIANIASAILVSSNPTNLVLAGAFNIKFINYTANMIVPVVATAIVLFPFLLYIVFGDETLIPLSIKMHELSEEARAKEPVNPNIPYARGGEEGDELLELEEIMNPFLDNGGAVFGAVVISAALVTILVLNAVSRSGSEHPVFWVTLPAAFIMLCWDVASGWYHRHETREIARKGRQRAARLQARARRKNEDITRQVAIEMEKQDATPRNNPGAIQTPETQLEARNYARRTSGIEHSKSDRIVGEENLDMKSVYGNMDNSAPGSTPALDAPVSRLVSRDAQFRGGLSPSAGTDICDDGPGPDRINSAITPQGLSRTTSGREADKRKKVCSDPNSLEVDARQQRGPTTLLSLVKDAYRWLRVTFPTVMVVLSHLPYALVPFALCMFILVQALVTKGWVPVFAYGWDHWVNKTGTVGSIGGMGFLSVILCNVSSHTHMVLRNHDKHDSLTLHPTAQFAGTNIGTTILLSRVIQAWQQIHKENGTSIPNRTFWGTVYGMAIGVNYGAFSTAFSASLAGLLWRDILARKNIRVKAVDFARVKFPIIAISMAVGCTVLVGEVYIMRDTSPYDS